jgi:hypothetical protein
VKDAFEIASPMMFGTGALGAAARSAIGTYNLLNSEGIAKTYNLGLLYKRLINSSKSLSSVS